MGFPIVGQDIKVVSPTGIAPGGVGTPTVSPKNRKLFPAGIAPGAVGTQFVSLRVRTFRLPASRLASSGIQPCTIRRTRA